MKRSLKNIITAIKVYVNSRFKAIHRLTRGRTPFSYMIIGVVNMAKQQKSYTGYWVLGLLSAFLIPTILAIGSYFTLLTKVEYQAKEISTIQADVKAVKEVQASDKSWLDQKKLDTEVYNKQREEDNKRFEKYQDENKQDHKEIAGKLDKIIDGLSKKK